MASDLLGRTNRAFPPVWLSLSPPQEAAEDGWLDALVGAAIESGAPIDVSSSPGLWGGRMRATDATLMTISGTDMERATDEKHAVDLVQAHLIETLCAVGRDYMDLYYLRVRRAVEEYQINGALQALELAVQEGHIRHLGLCCDGPSFATLGLWQFHDAFETLLVPRNHYDAEAYDTLAPLAAERRVGIVTSRPLNWGYGLPFFALPEHWRLRNLTQGFYGLSLAQAAIADLSREHPVLVGVRTAEEVRQAVKAPTMTLPDGLRAWVEPYVEAWNREETWAELAVEPEPSLRRAAARRVRELSH